MTVLGIDTSNYRTSICLIDSNYQVIQEVNPLLEVKQGELGMQQSVALFQHLKTWPSLLKQLDTNLPIKAVGVSTRPRPVPDSYMPVFKAGEVLAETIAHFLCVPIHKTSHQEGHVAAGEYSLRERPYADQFIAVHLSGGTSEILHCQREHNGCGYQINRLGGTLDLHAGQFVDRVGVHLGFSFPAGPELEKEAQLVTSADELPIIPSFTKGVDFSFSGPTSHALRLIKSGQYEAKQIARAVEKTIVKTLEKALKSAVAETGLEDILVVGGVAANQFITSRLHAIFKKQLPKVTLYFATPKYATDNAFGIACLALNWFKANK